MYWEQYTDQCHGIKGNKVMFKTWRVNASKALNVGWCSFGVTINELSHNQTDKLFH